MAATSTFWPSSSMLDALEVTQREPVGVGRHEPQPVPGRGEQDPGEDRAGVVARRTRHHLAQRLRERGGVHPHAGCRRLGQAAGTPTADSVRSVVANRPASICASSLVSSMFTVPAVELVHDLREQPCGQHGAAVRVAVDRDPHADRELEIGADELQLAAGDGQAQARQHRHRAGS